MRTRLSLILFIPVLAAILFAPGAYGETPAGADTVTVTAPGLGDAVEVWRDDYGVAHIRAANEDDLFFAFGYIVANDRLFNLEGSRRVAQGRISEAFGGKWLDMDKTNRDIGFRRIGELMYENLSLDTKRRLDRYTDGINNYIETHIDNLSLEFKILGIVPEPWRPQDSLALLRLFSWWLSSDSNEEQLRTYFAKYYGEDISMALMPVIPPGSDKLFYEYTDDAAVTPADGESVPPPEGASEINGSNCWAVAPGITEDGYAILASDPHIELFAPSSWYQVHLTGGGIDVIGITFPGLPAVAIGHNANVSWGASNMPFDIQDYTLLETDREDRTTYRWGDEWLEFEVEEETIKVKTGDGVDEIAHKRLMSEAGFVVYRGQEYMAMRWTGSEPNDDLTPLMNLMFMQSAEDLYDAMADFNCAPQSFIAADVDGNIAQAFCGKIPIRNGYSGLISARGSEKPGWPGYVTTGEMPKPVNPPENFLAHLNTLPDICVGIACGRFKQPYAQQRVVDMLTAGAPVDVDYMKSMQMDVVNLFARKYIEYLRSIAGDIAESERDAAKAASMLTQWDLVETEDSSEATLFHEWFIIFSEKVFKGVISSTSYGYYEDNSHAIDLILGDLLKGDGNPLLFKWVKPEDVKRMAIDALDNAMDSLDKQYGAGPEHWRWGDVHKTNFKHPSGVEFLLGAGEYPDRGSRYTIKVADFFNSTRYESTFGVSYRQIVEMRPGDVRGWWVLPPGNHGSPLSPHYRDQVMMWLKGEYAPMWFSENDVKSNCTLAGIIKPE